MQAYGERKRVAGPDVMEIKLESLMVSERREYLQEEGLAGNTTRIRNTAPVCVRISMLIGMDSCPDFLSLPVFLSVSTGSGKLSFPRTSWRNSPDSRSLA